MKLRRQQQLERELNGYVEWICKAGRSLHHSSLLFIPSIIFILKKKIKKKKNAPPTVYAYLCALSRSLSTVEFIMFLSFYARVRLANEIDFVISLIFYKNLRGSYSCRRADNRRRKTSHYGRYLNEMPIVLLFFIFKKMICFHFQQGEELQRSVRS